MLKQARKAPKCDPSLTRLITAKLDARRAAGETLDKSPAYQISLRRLREEKGISTHTKAGFVARHFSLGRKLNADRRGGKMLRFRTCAPRSASGRASYGLFERNLWTKN